MAFPPVRIKDTAEVPSAGAGLKKGMRVRKPSPKQQIAKRPPLKAKKPPVNTGGGLPFFNPYKGAGM